MSALPHIKALFWFLTISRCSSEFLEARVTRAQFFRDGRGNGTAKGAELRGGQALFSFSFL